MAEKPDGAEQPVLEALGLVKAFSPNGGPGFEVLRGVDLTLHRGEMAAIVGPSGSGKSTLLHCLGLMDDPTGGELSLFGRPARGMPEVDRSRLRNEAIGFVFQFDSMLPEFTFLENVAMPGLLRGAPARQALERSRELLAAFGLEGLAPRFPRHSSGGERQRAAIARALHNRPALVLADEPTGNLDRPNGELVFKDLRRLASEFGAAVAVVTHNEAAAASCDRVHHLRDGRILEGVPGGPRP